MRAVRPDLWVAEDSGCRVLVRAVPCDRLDLYRRAAAVAMPIPTILYVGPDASGRKYIVVEELLGPEATRSENRAWRTLSSLTSLLADDGDRIALAPQRMGEVSGG